jgi:hypothetical protein
MGEAGKKRVAEQFSSETAGTTMLSIYENGLADSSTRRARR